MQKAEEMSQKKPTRLTARDKIFQKAAERSAHDVAADATDESDSAAEQRAQRGRRDDAGGTGGPGGENDGLDLLGMINISRLPSNKKKQPKKRAQALRQVSSDEEVTEEEQQWQRERAARQEKKARRQSRQQELLAVEQRRELEHTELQEERAEKKAKKRAEQKRALASKERALYDQENRQSAFRDGMRSDHESKTDEMMRQYKDGHRAKREAETEASGSKTFVSERGDSGSDEDLREPEFKHSLEKGHKKNRRKMIEEYGDQRGRHRAASQEQTKAVRRRQQEEEEERLERHKREEDWERQYARKRTIGKQRKDTQHGQKRLVEMETALEALRQVFGHRDEKLLTMWLAKANNDTAAAIDIGMAYDEKIQEQRRLELEAAQSGSEDDENDLDKVLSKVGPDFPQQRTMNINEGPGRPGRARQQKQQQKQPATKRAAGTEHEEEDVDEDQIGALLEQMAEFDQALDVVAQDDMPGGVASDAASDSAVHKLPDAAAEKKSGFFGRLFGKKVRQVENVENAFTVCTGAGASDLKGAVEAVKFRASSDDTESSRPPTTDSSRPPTATYSVGDSVQIFSKSAGEWVDGEVTQVESSGQEVTVEYGDRSRIVDLNAEKLHEYFRQRPSGNRRADRQRPRGHQVGDPVEIFSRSAGEWVDGEVTRAGSNEVTVEYGDRSRIVDLRSENLGEFFRDLRPELSEDDSDAEDSSSQKLQREPTSLLASLRVAQEKLQMQRADVEKLAEKSFGRRKAPRPEVPRTADAALGMMFGGRAKKVPPAADADDSQTSADGSRPVSTERKMRKARVNAEGVARDEDGSELGSDGCTGASEEEEEAGNLPDPSIENAKRLTASLANLNQLQETLSSRLPPVEYNSDTDSDREESADQAGRPGHPPKPALRQPLHQLHQPHIPDAAKIAAKKELDGERDRILALLAEFETKVSAEDLRLANEQATRIQMTYRKHLFWKRCKQRIRAEALRRRNAARTIWRAWTARQRRIDARAWRATLWEMRRAEGRALVLLQKRQHLAARYVQASWRGYAVRDRIRRGKAASVLQKYVRRLTTRRRSATVIASAFRSWKIRKVISPILRTVREARDEAATEIQRFARGRSTRNAARRKFFVILMLQIRLRRAYNKRSTHAGIIQRRYRNHAGRRQKAAERVLQRVLYTISHVVSYRQMIEREKNEAALCVQRMLRGKKNRTEFDIKRAATMNIQRIFRGRTGRAGYLCVQERRRKEEADRFLWATRRLQSRFRGRRMRGQMLGFFLNTAAACRMQRHWRGSRSRVHMKNTVHRWCACVVIQRGLRGWMMERTEAAHLIQRKYMKVQSMKQLMAVQNRRIVLVQALARGFLGRRVAERKWDELNNDFAECYRINRAIVRIQRAWLQRVYRQEAHKMAARIAAAMVIQRCWRRLQDRLRASMEWAARYHPLKEKIEEQRATAQGSGEKGPARPRRHSSGATSEGGISTGGVSGISGPTDSSAGYDAWGEGIISQSGEQDAVSQNIWVRDHLKVTPIWMRDELVPTGKHDTDSNMAHFFFKRGQHLAAVRCLESALRDNDATATVSQRCAININIATVLSQLNEFSKASDVLESSISLLVADVKAQDQLGSDGPAGAPEKKSVVDEKAFGLTALAVCYHNLAVQKLFMDQSAEAILCAEAALRLVEDTHCLGPKHPWIQRIRNTIAACKSYQIETNQQTVTKKGRLAGGGKPPRRKQGEGKAASRGRAKSAKSAKPSATRMRQTINRTKTGSKADAKKPRVKYSSDGKVNRRPNDAHTDSTGAHETGNARSTTPRLPELSPGRGSVLQNGTGQPKPKWSYLDVPGAHGSRRAVGSDSTAQFGRDEKLSRLRPPSGKQRASSAGSQRSASSNNSARDQRLPELVGSRKRPGSR